MQVSDEMVQTVGDVLARHGWEVGRGDVGPTREECDEQIREALTAALAATPERQTDAPTPVNEPKGAIGTANGPNDASAQEGS